MIDIKLDPCRYCGGEASVVEWEDTVDCNRMVIKCKRCGITLDHEQPYVLYHKYDKSGNFIGYGKISDGMSAVDIWNGGMLDD